MFICELIHNMDMSVTSDEEEINSTDNELISDNIEELRKEIHTYVDDSRVDYIYANPARFMLMNENYIDEWDGNIENSGASDIEADAKPKASCKTSNSTSTKASTKTTINDELSRVTDKEVIDFAKSRFNTDMEIKPFTWDLSKLTSNMIVRINGLNNTRGNVYVKEDLTHTSTTSSTTSSPQTDINSVKFGCYIDAISQMYDKAILIKPILSDPFSDELYLILGNQTKTSHVKNIIPINYERYIDFLYCIYTYATYVFDLLKDLKYNTTNTKVEFITLSTTNEYKFIVEKCRSALQSINI